LFNAISSLCLSATSASAESWVKTSSDFSCRSTFICRWIFSEREISDSEDLLVSELGVIVEDVVVEIEGSSSDVVRKGSVDSLSSKNILLPKPLRQQP
jgi:hypothetical protein